jgi:DnaJ-class molecular chaperone
MDFYNTLNLTKNATQLEIKKSYRKLALIYHPDKNTDPLAKEKFHKISEAYQTLSDINSRKKYDNYGEIPDQFINSEEMFKNIFSNMDPILGNFLSNTLSEFTESLLKNEANNMGDLLKIFKKVEFIEKGSDVMKYYLKKSVKVEDNDLNYSKTTYLLNLEAVNLQEYDTNEINVDIAFLRKYSHIKVNIKEDGKFKNFIINLINVYFTLEFNNKIYNFFINNKFPPGINRKSETYNLHLEYSIDIHHYLNGFYFEYPLYKNHCIKSNIKITNTNIICLPNEGLYNPIINDFGNFYVIFKPILSGLSEDNIKVNFDTIESVSIENLIK